jgi:hypothetical protein
VKTRVSWLLFFGVASLAAGFFLSRALIARSKIPSQPYFIHPVSSSSGEVEDKFPMVTVEYSSSFYPNIDHLKFSVGWGANTSSQNFVVLRHESEGWYLKDTLLSDANWSIRLNEEIRKDEPNYVVLAIHPNDPFKAAVDAADRCRAMRTSRVVQCIVIFQCGYD